MKKIKLLAPILGIATLSSAVIPLVGCSCKNEIKIKPELSDDTSTGVLIKDSNIVKGKESTITLTIPDGKEIETLEVTIGNKLLTKGTDYTFENNIIKIKADVVTGENVTVKVIVKDKTPTYTETVIISNDGKVYKADMETVCSDDTTKEIKGSELTTNADQTWTRDEFNCQIIIGTSVTSIGDNFLYGCKAFNNGAAETETNKPLTIPNNVTSIGENFLYWCEKFNQTLTLPNGITEIKDTFLCLCSSFNNGATGAETNKPLTIPNSVTKIEYGFLLNCTAFNNPINFSNSLQTIGQGFLQSTSFNQKIALPNTLISIGNRFLFNCEKFNQTITLNDGLETIGAELLNGCKIFSQNLTFPSSFKKIGQFLWNCGDYGKDAEAIINFSKITEDVTNVLTGDILLEDDGEPTIANNNTITFIVPNGKKTEWEAKIKNKTKRSTLPANWKIEGA